MIGVSFVCTYARTTRNCLSIPWKLFRVVCLVCFWVEIAQPHMIWSYFSTMLSPCMPVVMYLLTYLCEE
jgi:hypothetical protein